MHLSSAVALIALFVLRSLHYSASLLLVFVAAKIISKRLCVVS